MGTGPFIRGQVPCTTLDFLEWDKGPVPIVPPEPKLACLRQGVNSELMHAQDVHFVTAIAQLGLGLHLFFIV